MNFPFREVGENGGIANSIWEVFGARGWGMFGSVCRVVIWGKCWGVGGGVWASFGTLKILFKPTSNNSVSLSVSRFWTIEVFEANFGFPDLSNRLLGDLDS